MLFADVNLVRRIEGAECSMLWEIAEVMRAEPELIAQRLAGGVAVFAGHDSPVNKLAGLGFAGPLDEAALEALEQQFEQRQVPLQVELASLAETSIGTVLTRRGYLLVGFEDVMAMRLDASHARPAGNLAARSAGQDIQVIAAGAEQTHAWIDTIITGFEHPDVIEGITPFESVHRERSERFLAALTPAASFRRYLAKRNGESAGAAGLRLSDGVAQLNGAATLPAHRRRGVQSALLHARLRDAAAEGCDIAVMTTQPGSKSQENGLRHGFERLYTRAIFRRG